MAPRVDLQTKLETLLGSSNVYFQPPSSVVMQYPCIVYQRTFVDISHADNAPYKTAKQYQLTVIDKNPDSTIPDKVAALPQTRFVRHFTSDNLHHDVYNLYF